jgi:LysM repeat protein
MNEDKNWQNRICPYLGQRSDPETAISYPSGMNYCTHAKPIVAINLSHQEYFCLTKGYLDCEEYNSDPDAPRPPRLLNSSHRHARKEKRNGKWLWAVLLLGLGIVIFWLLLTKGGTLGALTGKPARATASSTATRMAITLPEPSNTPTFVPTLTPTQAGTATSRPVLGLETPLGIEHKFVIHQIQEGDSLSRIASQYGTTMAAIQAVNYRLNLPLLPGGGWSIVVPVNFVDVQGFPPFEVYTMISAKEVASLKDLATLLSVDLDQFKYYNVLDDNFVPQVGDHFLVPRTSSPTITP